MAKQSDVDPDENAGDNWVASMSDAVHIEWRRRMSEVRAVEQAMETQWGIIDKAVEFDKQLDKSKIALVFELLFLVAVIAVIADWLLSEKFGFGFSMAFAVFCLAYLSQHHLRRVSAIHHLQALRINENDYLYRWLSTGAHAKDFWRLKELKTRFAEFDDAERIKLWEKVGTDLREAASGTTAPLSMRVGHYGYY